MPENIEFHIPICSLLLPRDGIKWQSKLETDNDCHVCRSVFDEG